MPLSRSKALRLRELISRMNETQQREIYRILCNHSVAHTVKSDGIFFEDRSLTKEVIAEIETYIRFCDDVSNSTES